MSAAPPLASRRRRDRVGPSLVVLATLLGIWMGLAGPDVSPVQPPVPVSDAAFDVAEQAP